MIIGIGIDIVELERVEAVIERTPRILERILTEQERAHLPQTQRRKIEYVAGRFAAKEAISKALGVGIGDYFSWQSLSILSEESGKPYIVYHHPDFFTPKWGARSIHISIAHEKKNAVAFAVIEQS